jgi:hypothetical protein
MTPRGRHRRAGWNHLLQAARSADREERLVALVRGYAWIEHALDAADAPGPRRPIAARVLRTFRDATLSRGLDPADVRRAIGIRHGVSHDDTVPPPAGCLEAVETFRCIWHALSRHFVNLTTAVALGREILRRNDIGAVCLYGSLARGHTDPNDIDLLVLDGGTYSSSTHPGRYDDGTFNVVRTTNEALELLGLDSPKLLRCASCRWLDVMIIDGESFGQDDKYTGDLRAAQPDPWFFVNISRDLKELDSKTGEFKAIDRFPFRELRRSQADLARLGFA